MNDGTVLLYAVTAIAATIAIFFICRELVCWYWKQNAQVELLKDISFQLEELTEFFKGQVQPEKASPASSATEPCKAEDEAGWDYVGCPKCGRINAEWQTDCEYCEAKLEKE